ncbi:hypothetical protein [Sessilibacter sp. MAH4]
MTTPTDSVNLIDALHQVAEHYEQLKSAKSAFLSIFLSDANKTLPHWLPITGENIHAQEKPLIAQFLTSLENQNYADLIGRIIKCRNNSGILPQKNTVTVGDGKDTNEFEFNNTPAGIICVNPETILAANHFNTAKDAFRESINVVKTLSGLKKTKVGRIISQVLVSNDLSKEKIGERLADFLSPHLDLIACYRKIQILPKQLNSLSWTWMTQHREITRVHLDDAIKMALKLEDDYTRDAVLSQLYKEDSSKPLAYIKPIKPQLRANIAWREEQQNEALEDKNEHDKKKHKPSVKRKTIVTSSILLCQDTRLPRLKWPKDNLPSHRLERSDKKIEDHPIIHALQLYRYKPYVEDLESSE